MTYEFFWISINFEFSCGSSGKGLHYWLVSADHPALEKDAWISEFATISQDKNLPQFQAAFFLQMPQFSKNLSNQAQIATAEKWSKTKPKFLRNPQTFEKSKLLKVERINIILLFYLFKILIKI